MNYKFKEIKTGTIYDDYDLAVKLCNEINKSGDEFTTFCCSDIECIAKDIERTQYYLIDECNNVLWIDPERFEIIEEEEK